MPGEVEAREAEWGKRMIEVRVRFWTDHIAEGKGRILPKHAWDAGVIRMERNPPHGIAGGNPLPFNSLAEIPSKIERLLIDNDVKLHLGRRQRRYLVAD